jgi:hypothetical protein
MKVKEIREGQELKVVNYFWEGVITGLEIAAGLTGTVDTIQADEIRVDFRFEYNGRDYVDHVWVAKEDMYYHFEGVEEWNEDQDHED